MYISYREPRGMDGIAVHSLVNRCPPLDRNSLYCYLLQCTDFSKTSIVAESAYGGIIGFVSGYITPDTTDTLFIWQVALEQKYRGKGVASQMLHRLFTRHKALRRLKTTISPGNRPSQKLFQAFFENHNMTVETFEYFQAGVHLDSGHKDEVLYLGTRATSKAMPVPASHKQHHLTEVTG